MSFWKEIKVAVCGFLGLVWIFGHLLANIPDAAEKYRADDPNWRM